MNPLTLISVSQLHDHQEGVKWEERLLIVMVAKL